MKFNIIYKLTFSIVFLIALFNAVPVQSQWQRVKNLPVNYSENDGAYYLDVYFLPYDANFGWACGYAGRIVATTDGGKTWKGSRIITSDPLNSQFESIQFVNKSVGFCVDATESAIYKTTDGGANWKNISPKPNPGLRSAYWGTYFYDANLGVIMGGGTCNNGPTFHDYCRFYRTTDGGKTWDQSTADPVGRPTKPCDAVIMDAKGSGYAISSGLLWETDDALNWRIIDQTGALDWHEEITYDNGSFLVPVSEYCQGSTGNNYGGMRFKEVGTSIWRSYNTGVPMFGTCLLGTKIGWAVGHNRAVYYTSDAGKTWELRNCGVMEGTDLDDIYFANDTTGWLVGKGIYRWAPVDTTKPDLILENPVCPDEKGYIKVKNAADYEKLDWYINGKFYTSFYDSIAVKPGQYVTIVYEDWDKPNCGQIDSVLITEFPRSKLSILNADSLNLCKNDSLELICEQIFPKYLWSTGDTTKTTMVHKAGVYTVMVQDSNGCQYAESAQVKDVGLPSANIEIVGNNSICVKDSLILKLHGNYQECKWYRDNKNDENYISDKNEIKVGKQGYYFAVINSKWGCENTSDSIFVEVRIDSNRFDYRFAASDLVERFEESKYPELVCRDLTIYNITSNYEELSTAYFRNNISFSVPPGQLPYTIEPNGKYNLRVCYTSYNLPRERDTLLIFDRCRNHTVPMVAEVTADPNTGQSNCDIFIETTPKDIDKSFVAFFDRPYPNPAFEDIYIDVIGKIQEVIDADISIYDFMGNKISFEKNIFSTNTQSTTIKLSVKASNGTYFVKIVQGTQIVVYPIVILK
ncbi:MAG: YCF48-related protein [bacterium]